MEKTLNPDGNARERLLAAALELFVSDGFGLCRVEDIRKQANVSTGSFYHHFKSKTVLAAELYIHVIDLYHQAFLDTLRRQKSAKKGVQSAVHFHLNWVLANPYHASYLFNCLEPEVLEVSRPQEIERNEKFFAECIVWLNGHKELNAFSPMETYVLWMGSTLELTRVWLREWAIAGFPKPNREALLEPAKMLAKAAWLVMKK